MISRLIRVFFPLKRERERERVLKKNKTNMFLRLKS